MRIDGLNVYNKYDSIDNNRIKDELKKSNLLNSADKVSAQDSNDVKSNYLNGINTSKIITKQEKQYFKKMFPESSELIDKHVLFNRNAKIQSPSLQKGQLIDGLV